MSVPPQVTLARLNYQLITLRHALDPDDPAQAIVSDILDMVHNLSDDVATGGLQ